MQLYIDSCSTLYLNAINEIKGGADKDSTRLKYAAKIIFLHSEFSKTFDSLTLAYTNKKITQIEYDNIRESIALDSVGKRSEELSRLGVNIELR